MKLYELLATSRALSESSELQPAAQRLVEGLLANSTMLKLHQGQGVLAKATSASI